MPPLPVPASAQQHLRRSMQHTHTSRQARLVAVDCTCGIGEHATAGSCKGMAAGCKHAHDRRPLEWKTGKPAFASPCATASLVVFAYIQPSAAHQ
jgi:hypothetical protein